MSIPEKDFKFAASHEWLSLEGDLATVGISDYAQDSLGDIVYVGLPEVGDNVSAAEAVAVVESVKAASDIYSPVSGVILEVNIALEDAPEEMNESPYEKGWLYKIQLADTTELESLMDIALYQKTLE